MAMNSLVLPLVNYLELLKFAAPHVTVAVTALVVLALGIADKRHSWCGIVAGFGLAAGVAVVSLLPQAGNLYHGMLVLSPLNSLFEMVCLLLAFLTVLLVPRETSNYGEYLAVILLATVGLLLLVSSEELLMIFIGLELTGLSLYVMTAFDKENAQSAEAGLKYFLFGSTASAFTFFGLSLIYGITGATSLSEIAQKLATGATQPLLAAGVSMSLVGFAFKVAVAPFHLWAPDTYQGAPASAAAFVASGSKVASFVVLGKILLIGFGPAQGSAMWHAMAAGWSPLVAVLAAFSILLGNLVALVQTNLRRLLAYSAVAHAGYTLLGLLAGGRDGFGATLFYTTSYAFTLIGAFGAVALVRRQTGGDNIENFAGLSARSPFLAGCMAIFMLSLAGLPPLAGFFGKFYLFSVALRAGANQGLLWLVIVALFGSLISLYYYLTVLKVIFGDEKSRSSSSLGGETRAELASRLTLALAAAIVLFLGALPGAFLARIANSF